MLPYRRFLSGCPLPRSAARSPFGDSDTARRCPFAAHSDALGSSHELAARWAHHAVVWSAESRKLSYDNRLIEAVRLAFRIDARRTKVHGFDPTLRDSTMPGLFSPSRYVVTIVLIGNAPMGRTIDPHDALRVCITLECLGFLDGVLRYELFVCTFQTTLLPRIRNLCADVFLSFSQIPRTPS